MRLAKLWESPTAGNYKHEAALVCSGVTFRTFMTSLVQMDITNHEPFVRRGTEGEHLQNNGTAIKIKLIPFQTKQTNEPLQ